MSEATTSTQNPGKNNNVIGFVISLVALLLGGYLMGALYLNGGKAAAAIVLVLPIAAIVISVMGMKASKAAGHKAGLGVAGMVIGIVAAVWLLISFAGLSALESFVEANGEDVQQLLEQYEDNLQEAFEEAEAH